LAYFAKWLGSFPRPLPKHVSGMAKSFLVSLELTKEKEWLSHCYKFIALSSTNMNTDSKVAFQVCTLVLWSSLFNCPPQSNDIIAMH